MTPTTSLFRRALGLAALLLVGLASGLAIAELLARLAWRPTPAAEPAATTDPTGLPVLRTLAQLMKPNTRGVMPNGTGYRTNSLGVRGPEYDLHPPPDTFRIVVVGDSVTVGANVEEEDAYPARLEAALAARPAPPRYQVVNAGMAGLNLKQIVDRLEHVGLRYEPDLIIYGWTMNDIMGAGYTSFERGRSAGYLYREVYERYATSRSYLLRVLWPHWVSLSETFAPSPLSYVTELRQNYFDNPAAWGPFVADLDRLATIAARQHVCAVVFLHTSLNRLTIFHPLRTIYDHVAVAAEARGLHAVPSLQVFQGQDEHALTVSERDPHPNRAGHALLARALVDGLDALPAECWRRHGEAPPR